MQVYVISGERAETLEKDFFVRIIRTTFKILVWLVDVLAQTIDN